MPTPSSLFASAIPISSLKLARIKHPSPHPFSSHSFSIPLPHLHGVSRVHAILHSFTYPLKPLTQASISIQLIPILHATHNHVLSYPCVHPFNHTTKPVSPSKPSHTHHHLFSFYTTPHHTTSPLQHFSNIHQTRLSLPIHVHGTLCAWPPSPHAIFKPHIPIFYTHLSSRMHDHLSCPFSLSTSSMPTAHFLTPITYPFHSPYPPHAFPLFIPAKPIFSHSCIAMHGHVMPISPYANLHTRILHALMYITTLPCITILHLPIFLLLTTFLSLHHIPFMHCFLSLHHHYHQTLIF